MVLPVSYPSLWLYYKAWSLVCSPLSAQVWKSQHTPVAEARGIASSSLYTALQCTDSCPNPSIHSEASFCSLSCVFTWYKLVWLLGLSGASSAPWNAIMRLQCDWTKNSWTLKCSECDTHYEIYGPENNARIYLTMHEPISTISCLIHYICWPRKPENTRGLSAEKSPYRRAACSQGCCCGYFGN